MSGDEDERDAQGHTIVDRVLRLRDGLRDDGEEPVSVTLGRKQVEEVRRYYRLDADQAFTTGVWFGLTIVLSDREDLLAVGGAPRESETETERGA